MDTIYFTQCGPNWSKETDTIFLLVKMALLYAVPLVFMSFAYMQIIKVLWRSGRARNHAFGNCTVLLISIFFSNIQITKNITLFPSNKHYIPLVLRSKISHIHAIYQMLNITIKLFDFS